MIKNKNKNKAANALLFKASRSGSVMELGDAIKFGADINMRDEYGWTALMQASSRGYLKSAKMLIDAGADVNAKAYNWETTALIIAAYWGESEVAKLLIENGADIEAQNGHGNTPLAAALLYEHLLTVKLLIGAGANLDAKNNEGKKAREYARTAELQELVKAEDIRKQQLCRSNFNSTVEKILGDLQDDLRE